MINFPVRELTIEWREGVMGEVKIISDVSLEQYFKNLANLDNARVLVYSRAANLDILPGSSRSCPSLIYTDGQSATMIPGLNKFQSQDASYVAWVGRNMGDGYEPGVNLYLMSKLQMVRLRKAKDVAAPHVRLHLSRLTQHRHLT